jgi:hypothetical protein
VPDSDGTDIALTAARFPYVYAFIAQGDSYRRRFSVLVEEAIGVLVELRDTVATRWFAGLRQASQRTSADSLAQAKMWGDMSSRARPGGLGPGVAPDWQTLRALRDSTMTRPGAAR